MFNPRSLHGLILGVGGDGAKRQACALRAEAEVVEAQETPEEADARRAEDIGIVCDLGDVPDRAAAFIAKGLSVSEVLTVLTAEREATEMWDRLVGRHNAQVGVRH